MLTKFYEFLTSCIESYDLFNQDCDVVWILKFQQVWIFVCIFFLYSFKQALNMYLMKVQLFRCLITHRMTLGVREAVGMFLFLHFHPWHPQKLSLLLRPKCCAKYFRLSSKLLKDCSSLCTIKAIFRMGLMQSCPMKNSGQWGHPLHQGRGAHRGWCFHQGPRGHVFHLHTGLLRRT
jgi:hypothetical protein